MSRESLLPFQFNWDPIPNTLVGHVFLMENFQCGNLLLHFDVFSACLVWLARWGAQMLLPVIVQSEPTILPFCAARVL